jgi:hypothetical protein
LATFPELFEFIEVIANRYPNDVLSRFLGSDRLDKSAIPIFKGIWASAIRDYFTGVVAGWIDNAKYLRELSVAFLSLSDIDLVLIDKFVDKAILIEDLPSLSSFLGVFSKSQACLSGKTINRLFEKIVTLFNQQRYTGWINHMWFSPKGESFMQALSKDNRQLVIDNLVFVNHVDHSVEGVLEQIAQKNIGDIFYFFEQRIEYKKRNDKELAQRYEDIPYSLYSIKNVLAENPTKLISLIKRNYEYEYGINQYGIARLFKGCFSPFEPQLIDLIFEHLSPSIEEELQLILAIASSYEGHSSILPLVKRLLIALKYDEEKIDWINRVLIKTGIVHGEYGFAEAYKNKRLDIEAWFNDNNVNVVKFAHQYKRVLDDRIDIETKRADEKVALEKHKYDVDD